MATLEKFKVSALPLDSDKESNGSLASWVKQLIDVGKTVNGGEELMQWIASKEKPSPFPGLGLPSEIAETATTAATDTCQMHCKRCDPDGRGDQPHTIIDRDDGIEKTRCVTCNYETWR